jgi:hypothetical protein
MAVSSIKETEKVTGGQVRRIGWIGMAVKKIHVGRGILGRCVLLMQHPVSCHENSGRSLRTFSRSRHKTSQYYGELTAWPIRTNSLQTVSLLVPSRNCLRTPKRRMQSHDHPAADTFTHWLLRYASTIINLCITQLHREALVP